MDVAVDSAAAAAFFGGGEDCNMMMGRVPPPPPPSTSFLLSDTLPTPSFPPSPAPTPPNVGVSPHAPSPSPSQQQLLPFGGGGAMPPSLYRHVHPPQQQLRTTSSSSSSTSSSSSSSSSSPPSSSSSAAHDGAIVVKKVITLDDIERDILRTHGHLPADAKRKMVKAEFKRLKHCETVRQSRVRKKNERKDLRKVNEELEAELRAGLAAVTDRPDWGTYDESSWWDVTFKRFVHSIYEVRSLRREHGELRERLMFYDTVGEQLERLQADFGLARPGFRLAMRPSLGTIHFQPFTVDAAREIMLDSHEQALSFFRNMKWRHAAEHEKTHGWTQHQRITPDGRVQFNFTKRILGITADELVHKSWAMYCDLELYRGIYASVQRLEILQRINEDTLVIRRDLQEGTSAPIFRTIFLLFRIRIDHGYVICFRSHNPPVFADDDDDDPNVQWMDMFYWLMVLDGHPDRGCDVSFGGNLLNARSAQHATRWKYQIAMALLRWESNAVAPLFAMLG